MILLRIRNFWFLILLGSLCILTLGIFGWITLQHPAVAAGFRDNATAKRIGENVLFSGIVLSLLFSGAGLSVGIRTRRNRKKAESFLSSGQWMKAGEGKWRSLLGDLGVSFYRMNKDLLETNTRRGIKIQGLSALAGFLVQNFGEPIMITNARGEVVYVSTEYLEKTGKTRSDILQQNVEEFLSDIRLNHLLSDFLRSPATQEIKAGGKQFFAYPIRDSRNETVYIVFSLGSKTYHVVDTQEGATAAPETFAGSRENVTDWIRQGIGKMFARRRKP